MIQLLWLLGCAPPEPDPPSVLLVTLDTTRADRLGPYGYALAETPTLDGLARDGTTWLRAYSTSPLTIPSHSTILTGRAPPTHGVRDNGDHLLSDDAVTLAERFRDAGYATAAFTSAFPTQARWGFAQGFDVYHDPLERPPTELDWRDQRPASDVVDDALATLEAGEGPSFVWVHLFDAHWPYEPPQPWRDRHAGRPYDGEIAYADAQLGRLIAWWDREHPGGIVIVTADHGEGLGDGGELTHGFLLHDGTIRVPLVARGPGLEAGARVDDVVSHVDLAPTVLALAGLPLHEGLQGRDLRDGGSGLAWSEARTGLTNLGLAPLHGFTDVDGRYVEGAWGAWYEAEGAQVATSPSDRDPVAGHQRLAALAASFEAVEAPEAALDEAALEQLAALGYLGGAATSEPGDVDPRDVIDLVPLTWRAREAIAAGAFAEAEALIETLEGRMAGAWGVDLLRAELLRRQGRRAEAAEAFTGLWLRSPSSTVALQLAAVHEGLGDPFEARGWYDEALLRQPASPEAMAGLVRTSRALGDDALALELAWRFLVAYPEHHELALIRAELLLLERRPEEALVEAEQARRRVPGSVGAQALVAQALWELGRADEAIDALQEALRLDPWDFVVRMRLAACLLDVQRNAEAVRVLALVVRTLPDDPRVNALHGQAVAALEAERAG